MVDLTWQKIRTVLWKKEVRKGHQILREIIKLWETVMANNKKDKK